MFGSVNKRGQYAYDLAVEGIDWDAARELTARFVAMDFKHGRIQHTWESANMLRHYFGYPEMPFPGKQYTDEEIDSTGIELRQYQKDAVRFMAPRAYGICALAMRCGKSRTLLASALVRGSTKNLILCPKSARPGWCREILNCTGKKPLICYERGADKARWYGDHWYKYRSKDPMGFEEAFEEAEWIICNYDLLVMHKSSTMRGVEYYDQELPGWEHFLKRQGFEICIADECHKWKNLDYRDRNADARGMRATAIRTISNIPVVWGATGTPMGSYVKDFLGQLDVLSDGLYNTYWFQVTFCDAHHEMIQTPRGEQKIWVATERDRDKTPELKHLLSEVIYEKSRAEIAPELPRKQRTVIEIDGEGSHIQKRGADVMKAQVKTMKEKAPYISDAVFQEMAEGFKTVVFVRWKESLRVMVDQLKKDFKNNRKNNMLPKHSVRFFELHGDMSADYRDVQGQEFMQHDGPAAVVATIDSTQLGVSLGGANFEHFAEMHDKPEAMVQSEDRPYEMYCTGLHITYWLVKGTVDEEIKESVMEKLVAVSEITKQDNAKELAELMPNVGSSTSDLIDMMDALGSLA